MIHGEPNFLRGKMEVKKKNVAATPMYETKNRTELV
jgi:hypothetical protein